MPRAWGLGCYKCGNSGGFWSAVFHVELLPDLAHDLPPDLPDFLASPNFPHLDPDSPNGKGGFGRTFVQVAAQAFVASGPIPLAGTHCRNKACMRCSVDGFVFKME